eukprot:NODE_1487_length_889_cov_315.302381_g1122_i1.p1 GENE.NODE_1487_length_889_cov_315.302381_g1122_i1~~NODE_1487_length_889_cov_315.302381_g1122_i1.p1  ORF type:complete len:244 (-),score=43.95 NODE_1487_length_889_cov_315.302381_g1122_i1:95-826(-)
MFPYASSTVVSGGYGYGLAPTVAPYAVAPTIASAYTVAPTIASAYTVAPTIASAYAFPPTAYSTPFVQAPTAKPFRFPASGASTGFGSAQPLPVELDCLMYARRIPVEQVDQSGLPVSLPIQAPIYSAPMALPSPPTAFAAPPPVRTAPPPPAPVASNVVAARQTYNVTTQQMADYLDMKDGVRDGKYDGVAISFPGGEHKGDWEARDQSAAARLDYLDGAGDGGFDGSGIKVSGDGYVDGRL